MCKYFLKINSVLLFLLTMLVICNSFAAEKNDTDYQVQPGDVLKITVLGEDELNREVKVSQKYKINFPLIGDVDCTNKSVCSLVKSLTELLNNYLVNPQVSIFVTQFGTVYIYGKVSKPGSIELNKKVSLLEALTLVGGLTDYANPKKISIIRTIGNKKTSIMIDLNSIIYNEKNENNIELLPGDVVVVPERMI